MNALHETRTGALCIPTGQTKKDGPKNKALNTYVHVQMLPFESNRFEWVREENIRPLKEKQK